MVVKNDLIFFNRFRMVKKSYRVVASSIRERGTFHVTQNEIIMSVECGAR